MLMPSNAGHFNRIEVLQSITCRLWYWNIINELGVQCSVTELCSLNNLREVSQIKEDLWTHIQIKRFYTATVTAYYSLLICCCV